MRFSWLREQHIENAGKKGYMMASDRIPDNAEEALAQGWHMVCVIPHRTDPPNLIELILPHFEHVAYNVMFTHKGRTIEARNQSALWVKNFRWSVEGRNVLLRALFSKNAAMTRFLREILGQFMPPTAIAKRVKNKPYKSRHGLSKVLEGRATTRQRT